MKEERNSAKQSRLDFISDGGFLPLTDDDTGLLAAATEHQTSISLFMIHTCLGKKQRLANCMKRNCTRAFCTASIFTYIPSVRLYLLNFDDEPSDLFLILCCILATREPCRQDTTDGISLKTEELKGEPNGTRIRFLHLYFVGLAMILESHFTLARQV